MLRPSTRNPAIGAEKNGNLIRAEGVLGCLAKGNFRIARNTSGTVLKLQITFNKPSMTAAACGTLTGSYLTSTRTGGEAIPLATTTSSLGPFSSLAGTSK